MPKHRDPRDVAEMLLAAQVEPDRVVAARWKSSESTLRRYRRRVAQGKCPDISAMIVKLQDESLEAARDRLTEVYDRFLSKAMELADECTINQLQQLIEGIKVVGDLKVTREALNGSSNNRQGKEASEAPRRSNVSNLRQVK